MMWDLQAQEVKQHKRRAEEEEYEATRCRITHWYDVRTESSFLERSRRRKPGVMRTTELYLREDLHCGIDQCDVCESNPIVRLHRPKRCMQSHNAEYVVPDAFCLLQCMELLEEPAFSLGCSNLLVLETVLQEALRIAPPRDTTRLRNFFRDDRRMIETCCVHLFPNQHHRQTHVETLVLDQVSNNSVPMERHNARDARALLKTMVWYDMFHVTSSSRLVFMSHDPSSELAHSLIKQIQRIQVLTCEDFVTSRFPHKPFLMELAVNTADAIHEWQSQQEEDERAYHEFSPHLPLVQLNDRVNQGTVFCGILEVSRYNAMEAFVSIDLNACRNLLKSINIDRVLVYGREAMNRGIHGDRVALELLPQTEWRAPSSESMLVHYVEEDENKSKTDRSSDLDTIAAIPTAVVVGILERGSKPIVATVLSNTVSSSDDIALAIPLDPRIPKIRIRSQRMDTLVDQRLQVSIDHWPIDSMYPHGHYTGILGPNGVLSTELCAILVDHEIQQAPYCESALADLPVDTRHIETYHVAECSTAKRPQHVPLIEWHIPPQELAQRRDLRHYRVFSVDPPGCQDIDDAMSIRVLPNGDWEIAVHIADVSFFIPYDSSLDYEGRTRGTSVYLVGQRLDMLPSVLSGDLCSLHEHVDRLAMSVLWYVDGKTLEIQHDKTWYGRTIIHSCASMTYYQAHRILQGLNADTGAKPSEHVLGVAGGPIPLALQHELAQDLRQLTAFSRQLARARGEDGGLDLSRSETFYLNVSELGQSNIEMVMQEHLEIHSTIAELMILANSSVARKIFQAFPTHALLRRHPPPCGTRFTQLLKIAKAKEIEIDASNNYTLQQSLIQAEASGRADTKTMALLKSLAIRVMSEAEYICASSSLATTTQDAGRFAHYGLGLEYYTHFTSPIRRYADIIVHRQLIAALALETTGQVRQLIYTRPTRVTSPTCSLVLPPSRTVSTLDTEEHEQVNYLMMDLDLESHDTPSPALVFPPEILVPLSQHLNHKNRQAKQASRACEQLCLAHYFRSHTIHTVAIITAMKQNGFLVYIPTYDLRAPVYLRDREGNVQMNPILCQTRIVDTQPATGGFAANEAIRLIPEAQVHVNLDTDQLDIYIQSVIKCSFRLLDEIEVQISCDSSVSNARMPQVQVVMVGRAKTNRKQVVSKPSVFPDLMQMVPNESVCVQPAEPVFPSSTLYDILQCLPKCVASKPLKLKKEAKVKKCGPGRYIYGNYEPVVIQQYQQKLAQYIDQRSEVIQEELNSQRYGTNGMDSIQTRDEMKRLERDVMSRTMKLQAEKRHDRINQRRKNN